MRVLVIGAAGRTGSAIVDQALAAGHQVTAFVHQPDEYTAPAGVAVTGGDVLDEAAVAAAVRDQDAVLDAVGGHLPFRETTLETNGARSVLAAMRSAGVKRLIILSTIGEGASSANVHGWYEHLVMPTLLRGVMRDKAGMEQVVGAADDLDWTIVRPAGLKDGDPKGQINIVTPESGDKVTFITRADVAAFVLAELSENQYIRQAVGIANP